MLWLCLVNNDDDTLDLAAAGEAIGKNTLLQSFEFDCFEDCRSPESIKLFCRGMASNPTLTSLHIHCYNVETDQPFIADEVYSQLSHFFRNNTNLEELFLTFHETLFGTSVSRAIEECKCLKAITISCLEYNRAEEKIRAISQKLGLYHI